MIIHIKGAGIAGCGLYRAALDLGHTPVLHDVLDKMPSSFVALAVLHSEGYEEAAYQYELWDVPTIRGAEVTGYRRKSTTPTWEERWIAVDPVESLNLPHTTSKAPDDAIDCTANPEWGERTWGATWINDDPESVKPGLRLHHYAPYKTLTAVSWSHSARLGSSSSKDQQKAAEQAFEQMEIAVSLGWINNPNDWQLLMAHRVKAPPKPGRFGGFHRDGWTLSALTAHDYIKNHTS